MSPFSASIQFIGRSISRWHQTKTILQSNVAVGDPWGQAKPSVSAYVRSIVRNHHDAEDVIQTTVSRIAEHFDKYDSSRPFVAWSLGYARLIVLEYRNKSSRKPLLLGDDALEALSGAIEKESNHIDDRHEALEHCVDRLKERHRMADPAIPQDESRQQIAEKLNVKENTVSVMLRRIRQSWRNATDRLGRAAQ